ncbi:hypothetical protein NP493_2517g00000 [Ridgeia piscesae]|uniref:Uncharacterized protein n=1 Tax=Ridgeia piscesae TaxID=27915 RepID=A0AAD9JFE9_RIDPI|nr:hypothetical protein NP493_2517g00000 [Ridgeia piscesae]
MLGGDVYIQSRQSADLFNVAQFRAKTKTTRILMTAVIRRWLSTLLKRCRK